MARRSSDGESVGHRLHRVVQEIEHHLLQLHAIAEDDDRIAIEVERHRHLLDDGFAAEQVSDVTNRRCQIDWTISSSPLRRRSRKPLDHVARAAVVVDDVGKDRVDLGDVWGIAPSIRRAACALVMIAVSG